MKYRIRSMTKNDVDIAGRILFEAYNDGAIRHGYPPKLKHIDEGKSWAWSLLHYKNNEIFVIEMFDCVAGITCLSPRGDLAGIGPVVVAPEFQGMKIGNLLMSTVIEKAKDVTTLRLFQEGFNVNSFSLFYSYGFFPVATLLNLQRGANVKIDFRLTRKDDFIEIAKQHDLLELLNYDSLKSMANRWGDIGYYLKWGTVFVKRYLSRIAGYLVCLPGSSSIQLGPMVADDEQIGLKLYNNAIETFNQRAMGTRIMSRDKSIVNSLIKYGFKIYGTENVMVRGLWRPGIHSEAFGIFPEGI